MLLILHITGKLLKKLENHWFVLYKRENIWPFFLHRKLFCGLFCTICKPSCMSNIPYSAQVLEENFSTTFSHNYRWHWLFDWTVMFKVGWPTSTTYLYASFDVKKRGEFSCKPYWRHNFCLFDYFYVNHPTFKISGWGLMARHIYYNLRHKMAYSRNLQKHIAGLYFHLWHKCNKFIKRYARLNKFVASYSCGLVS